MIYSGLSLMILVTLINVTRMRHNKKSRYRNKRRSRKQNNKLKIKTPPNQHQIVRQMIIEAVTTAHLLRSKHF